MPAWVIPAASAAASAVQSYLQSRRQKTEYGLSPESKWLFEYLQGQLGGPTPSYLTDPISQRYGALRSGIKESMGEALGPGSGLETAKLMRATAGETRAIGAVGERHQASILDAIASVVGGTGQRTTTMPMDIGSPLQDIGWAIWMATHGKNKGGGQGAGGGGGYSPGGYRPGRSRNVEMPRGYW